jgi:2-dehydropantoate 2-reductase
MKIFILGAGAIGSLLGARLSIKNKVIFYSTDTQHIRTIQKKGLQIQELNGTISNYKIKAILDLDELVLKPDLVLICLKTYSTKEGILSLKEKIKGTPIFLTLQNGIGNIEKISQIIPLKQIIVGVTSQGATLTKPGYIIHGGIGPTYIGEIDGLSSNRAENIVNSFNQCGLETYLSNNIQKLIWKKLIINIGINAITAITKVKNMYIAESNWAKKLSKQAVKEAIEVAKAKNIHFKEEDIFDEVIKVAKKTGKNLSSMHQDILNKKNTEIDSINRAIVELGKKYKIKTPINKTLTYLIKIIEEKNRRDYKNE